MADQHRSRLRSLFRIQKALKSFISNFISCKDLRFSKKPRSTSIQERNKRNAENNPNHGTEKYDEDYMAGSVKSRPMVSRTMSASRSTSRNMRRSTTGIPQTNMQGRRNFANSGNLRGTYSGNLSSGIIYTSSSGPLKLPPMELPLECSLEDLFSGCIKKVYITKHVGQDYRQVKEELVIKVEPGWRIGTKIIFQGRGDQMLGVEPADVIFVIEEERHQHLIREGDDLNLEVDIPLVDALTGCNLSIPLLGGNEMSLVIDDIIYPGYEKIVTGQGMPSNIRPERRGDLRITFRVIFPDELTDETKSGILNMLQDCAD